MVSPLTVTSPGKRPCTESKRKQMRIGLDRRQIVYGDDFDVVTVRFDDGAQNIAADAAKPVDGDANRHSYLPVSLRRQPEMRGGDFYMSYSYLVILYDFPNRTNAASATFSAVMPK